MNKEQKYTISEDDIPYPSEWEKQQRIHMIVEQSLPRDKDSVFSVFHLLKQIGIKNIFYQSGVVFLLTGLLFFLTSIAIITMLSKREGAVEYLVIAMFPFFHLLISIMTIWLEEQQGMVSLKMSCKYSLSMILSFRMLVFSFVALGMDIIIFLYARSVVELSISTAGVGFSFLFLFAYLSLLITKRSQGVRGLIVLLVIWIATCIGLYNFGNRITELLLITVPTIVHFIAGVIWMCLFVKAVNQVMKEEVRVLC